MKRHLWMICSLCFTILLLGCGPQTDLSQPKKKTPVKTSPSWKEWGQRLTTLNHAARYEIEVLRAENIITPFQDGNYRLNESLTRAQFANLLYLALLRGRESYQPFKDVPTQHWAAQAISAVAEAGYMTGYEGQYFKPDRRMTRQEALVSLAAGLRFHEVTDELLGNSFDDASEITPWARKGIASAEIGGLLSNRRLLGANGRQLQPTKDLTRGEAASYLFYARIYKRWMGSPKPEDLAEQPLIKTSAETGPALLYCAAGKLYGSAQVFRMPRMQKALLALGVDPVAMNKDLVKTLSGSAVGWLKGEVALALDDNQHHLCFGPLSKLLTELWMDGDASSSRGLRDALLRTRPKTVKMEEATSATP